MAIVYLTPEDLSPAQTGEVLAFLNSAQSAREIAERVEIPGELDVGLRVGQRILDHRAQLPDGFVNLKQLMDVKQVGPERFTEIVTTILGLPLPGISFEGLDQRVRREVAAQLGQAIPGGAAARRFRIAVQPPPDAPWLGQEITLTLKITAADSGRAVANLPVSMESADMWLATQFGYDVRAGQVVSTRTASDGSLRLRLRNLFDERLSVDQQVALQDALRTLDPAAQSPRELRAGLLALVDLYEDARNKRLRAAMDIVYRSLGRGLADGVNQQDYLYEWRYHPGMLRVYLGADSQPLEPGAVIANAAAAEVGIYHVAWKQWLLPWYQLYLERLSASDLQQEFLDARQRLDSGAGLSAEILGQAYRFVAAKNGLVGEALGKRVIDREIRHFLAREVTTLPPEDQLTMFPSLLLAGNTIGRADTGTLAFVNQTRADLEVSLGQRIADTAVDNDEILSSLGTLNSRVDQLDSNLVGVQGSIGQINTRLDGIDLNVLTLDGGFQQLTSSFNQFELDFGQLGASVDLLDESFTQLDSGLAQVTVDLQQINAGLAQIGGDIRGINSGLVQVTSEVQVIDAGLTQMTAEVGRIDAGLARMSGDIEGINAGMTQITGDLRAIDAGLLQMSGDVQGIDTGLAQMTAEVGRVDSGLVQMTGDIADISAAMTQVSGEISAIDSSLGRVATDVQGIDAGLEKISGDVQRISGDLQRVDSRVTGIDNSVTSLNRNAVLASDITLDSSGRPTGIRRRR